MAKNRGGAARNGHGARYREEAAFRDRALATQGVKKVTLGHGKGRRHPHAPGYCILRESTAGSLSVDVFVPGGVRRVFVCLAGGASADEVARALGLTPP